MKYVRFLHENKMKYGCLKGDEVLELDGDFLCETSKLTGQRFKLNDVQLMTPVEPKQVICIGLNYALHAEESGKPIPKEPMIFMVSPSAIIGSKESIVLPNMENRIDYEGELVIVIGKESFEVKKEDALDYIFGYTCGNDVSDRVLQKKDGQFTRAKSFATFKPIGPVVVTEVVNPNNLEIKLTVNNEVKQHSNTNDLIHDVESIIEAVTSVMKLYPGDVIMTGTPSGVAGLKPGDEVELEIEGVGTLVNDVQIKV